jgi:predicted RecB family nuclease
MKLSFSQRTTRREVAAITAIAALVLTQSMGTLTRMTLEFSQIRFLESLENSTGDEPSALSSPQETANTYRQQADRLLQQNRIGEAPEVLDWLKLREIEGYLSAKRGNSQPEGEVAPPSPAQPIEDSLSHGNEIQLGKELAALLAIPAARRTTQERQRIAQLIELQGQIRQRFNHFIRTNAVKAMQRHLNDTTREQNLRLTNLIFYLAMAIA